MKGLIYFALGLGAFYAYNEYVAPKPSNDTPPPPPSPDNGISDSGMYGGDAFGGAHIGMGRPMPNDQYSINAMPDYQYKSEDNYLVADGYNQEGLI